MGVRLSREGRAHQPVPVADGRAGLLRRGRRRPLQRRRAQPETLSRTHGRYQVVSQHFKSLFKQTYLYNWVWGLWGKNFQEGISNF